MNDKKTVSFGMALAIIFLPILVILLGGLVLRVGFLVPLMLATITASLLSIMAGFTWKEVEACIVNGVHRIIIVTCILFLVGTLIGVWIQAGVIPLFLYWGLKLLSPSMFLVSTVLICAVFSLMTGTSFGTIGTAGLALLGVGEALGFPTGLTAGAIVSGAYFGDKMSPVSDTTNLASGITGTNIFSHIGSMLYTTVPATLVALGLYWYLGLNYSGGAMPDLTPITDALSANFNRSFLLALPPIVLVALAIRGIPPLPTLVIAILVGVVCAFVIQDGMTVKGMFKAATDGYVSQTGHPLVDKILSRGGLTSMSFVVFLLLIAMTLGGILEGTGALGVVVDRMTRSVTSPGGLILATLVSCYLMTIGTGNGMLSIIVPARAFEKKFRDMGIQSRVLSRTLEDAVTLGIALVPYSMAAFFIANGLKSASISSVTQTADALRREGKEVLVFSIGRPDFDTPEHIKAAANDALAKGFVHYTHNRGILPMREAVAAYLKRQNGLDYDPKTEIMITAGAQEALMLCTHALLDPGDEVLVPSPGFLLYYSSIPMLHAVPVPYVLKEPDYDWDGAPVSDRTKLMIFNNPNNPTGKVFSAEEMRDAADFVKKHDLLAISDEAYDRLLYGDARHRSLAAEPDMRERTLLVGSLSKTYSMTGWRLGYVAGAPELIERLARLQQNYMLSVTSFAQYGGAEALNGPQECVETMRRAFEERRKVLIEGLTGAPNIRFNNPEGAFYLFIDHRDTGLDSVTFCKRLLEEQLVACVPGDDFGPSGEGHIRISYATSTENCAEGARRIRAFLNNL